MSKFSKPCLSDHISDGLMSEFPIIPLPALWMWAEGPQSDWLNEHEEMHRQFRLWGTRHILFNICADMLVHHQST